MTRKKILVIDDEPGFTEMVKLNLEATGYYDVIVENQGSRALTTALKFRPDLILLDVIMPDMEGPEVVCQIRNHNLTCDTPIVFLTATVTQDEVEAQDGIIGGHVFLAKPGGIHELIECIQRQLSPAL